MATTTQDRDLQKPGRPEQTTHETLLHDEADSAVASQAIHDVVRSVRTGSPLAQQ